MNGRLEFVKKRLEYKIFLLFLVVLIPSFVGVYLLVSSNIRKNLLEEERVKSRLLANTIHETVDRDMMVFRADVVRFLMEDLNSMSEVKRIQIVRGDAPYVGAGQGREAAFMDFKTLNSVKGRISTLYKMEWEREHSDKAVNIAPGTDHPAFKEFFEKTVASLKGRKLLKTDEHMAKAGEMDAQYTEMIDGVEVITYVRPLPNFPKCALCHGMDHAVRGMLMISTPLDRVDTILKQSQRLLFMASAGTVLILAVLLRLLMKRVVLSPLRQVVARINDIAEGEGDLTARIEADNSDEIGDVARSFNKFIGKLQALVSQVSVASRKVNTVSGEVLTGAQAIMDGAQVQINAIDQSSSGTESMNRSIQAVARNADSMAILADQSVSAVMKVSTSIDEIARSAGMLSNIVEDSTASILQMSSSVKEIDTNVKNLNRTADDTHSSLTVMDNAIAQIRTNVHETVKLASGVTQDAERGRKATDKTIEGIGKIREYSGEVGAVIQNLKGRTENIGKILSVIDEVAEQTNLLALNAAIIAAQAGEHGRSFSVVAQEIKELADRTSTSTGEIHDIIRALQDESRNAVQAIHRGITSVEEGMRLSQEAGSSLQQILENSRLATGRIEGIARSTDDQTKSVCQVVDAMNQVIEMVQQIGKATNEQARGAEFIIGSITKLRDIALKVKGNTQEQAQGSRQINEIVERLNRQAREIAQSTGKQTGESAQIVGAVAQIKHVIEQNVNSAGQVGMAVEELKKQAGLLSREIDKFKT